MDLSWSTAERAEGGYQYRYATDPAALLVCVPGSECEWKPATDSAGETTYKIQEGTLTVGTTYFFQVRAVNDEGTSDDDSDDTFSDPSAIDSAVQRAKPPEVENLVATAGNAQVTLTWTHLAAYDITSYIILREGGSGRGTRTSITEEEYELNDDDTEATYTVEKLVNGTEYSFHVKGRNIKGERDDPPRRTSSL